MKKIKFLIAAIVFLFSSIPVEAHEITPKSWKVVRLSGNESLNIRELPMIDDNKNIISRIPANTKNIKNLGCTNDHVTSSAKLRESKLNGIDAYKRKVWCLVEYNDYTGWVSSFYLAAEE